MARPTRSRAREVGAGLRGPARRPSRAACAPPSRTRRAARRRRVSGNALLSAREVDAGEVDRAEARHVDGVAARGRAGRSGRRGCRVRPPVSRGQPLADPAHRLHGRVAVDVHVGGSAAPAATCRRASARVAVTAPAASTAAPCVGSASGGRSRVPGCVPHRATGTARQRSVPMPSNTSAARFARARMSWMPRRRAGASRTARRAAAGRGVAQRPARTRARRAVRPAARRAPPRPTLRPSMKVSQVMPSRDALPPVGDLGPEHQAGVVAEIRDDHGGAEVVDRGERTARRSRRRRACCRPAAAASSSVQVELGRPAHPRRGGRRTRPRRPRSRRRTPGRAPLRRAARAAAPRRRSARRGVPRRRSRCWSRRRSSRPSSRRSRSGHSAMAASWQRVGAVDVRRHGAGIMVERRWRPGVRPRIVAPLRVRTPRCHWNCGSRRRLVGTEQDNRRILYIGNRCHLQSAAGRFGDTTGPGGRGSA